MSNVSPERSLNRKQLLMANNPGYKGAASLSPRVASQNTKHREKMVNDSTLSAHNRSIEVDDRHGKGSAERQSLDDAHATDTRRVAPFDIHNKRLNTSY